MLVYQRVRTFLGPLFGDEIQFFGHREHKPNATPLTCPQNLLANEGRRGRFIMMQYENQWIVL